MPATGKASAALLHMVAQLEITAEDRHEPCLAAIERVGWQRCAEGVRCEIVLAQKVACQSMAEPGHHRDAAAVAAGGVVAAVRIAPEMWQGVQRHRDLAAP